MNRKIALAGLATLTLIVSTAAAPAQGFYGYGGRYGDNWGYRSYASGSFIYPTRHRPIGTGLRSRNSGFYLVGSRFDTDDYPYSYGDRGQHKGPNQSPVRWRVPIPMR
jgi:hypothetical protein